MFVFFALFVAMITTFHCANDVKICDQMNRQNKNKFDYSFTLIKNEDVSEHYIVMNGYAWQIYHYSDGSLRIYTDRGVQSPISVDSGFAFSIRVYWFRDFYKYLLECYYKPGIKVFNCNKEYSVTLQTTKTEPQFDFFECSTKPIHIKRVIAYQPQSFTNSDNAHKVLFIERVVTTGNRRNVWITEWPYDMDPKCDEVNTVNRNIPMFLNSINDSLEIMGILPVIHNGKSSAIILFYDDGYHKYCITAEESLSKMCQTNNRLIIYLKNCVIITTQPTLTTHFTQTTVSRTNNSLSQTITSETIQTTRQFTTTQDTHPKSKSKIVIIIIGSIFLICAVLMIAMLCYICYKKYKIRKDEENRKKQTKYYKYKREDSESKNSGQTTNVLSASESTAKTTGFEISDEDVNTFNKSTSNSDETIENKGPKELMIWKKK